MPLSCSPVAIRAQAMGKRGHPQRYARSDCTDYGVLKRALPHASTTTRETLAAQLGLNASQSSIRIADASHLMVSEDLALDTGGTIKWEFLDPIKLVQHVLDHCSSLASVYADKLQECPSTPERPWRIQLGCDEQTPGSKVNMDNRRKNMCLMFNFLELGADVLECDASWFVPVVVRTSLFKHVVGGWSNLLKIILRRLLLGPNSFSRAGVLVHCKVDLELGSQRCLQLQATVQQCLTDGEGLQKCLQWNGHSSLRPSCQN